MAESQAVLDNRSRFPRGLQQPESGYRFSVDSLLLSCYPHKPAGGSFLELGAGCGAVSLGFLLLRQREGFRGLGIDADPQMVEAAGENAKRLGLQGHFRSEICDVADIRQSGAISPESFDLVLLNPPYRREGQGRQPRRGQGARTESGAVLADFLSAASYAVKNKGFVCLVYLAERLPELLRGLYGSRLEPKRMRPVHGKPDRGAAQVLVEARKNAGPELNLEPPLVLYSDRNNRLTRQALEFCPFLRCNSGD